MKSKIGLAMAFGLVAASIALSQTNEAPPLPPAPANAPMPSLQSPRDPGYAALIAQCKNPPPAPAPRGGRAGAGGGGGRGGAGARGAQPQAAVTITAIPGVIAGDAQWKFVWQERGNNGDGIVGTDDGGLLLAQNDNSQVVKLDKDGNPSVLFKDTHTGGAVSINKKGDLFVVERGLQQAIWELSPKRQLLVSTYMGDPMDCLGGVLDDLSADSKGGVYFTMGGLYYASPKGVITKYGENVFTDGIILSADEKTLYVTNAGTLVAFDVQPDGSLTNQRVFGTLTGGGGDGSTIDSEGRIYVTGSGGVHVFATDGKELGIIATPGNALSCAFGGKDKKTLFILHEGSREADGTPVGGAAQIWSIQMIAQGYKGRAK